MLRRVAAPFTDARAADLALRLGGARLPALDVLRVGALELRLLGASHQVVVDGFTETVACGLADATGALPPASTTPVAGALRHAFRSEVRPLDPDRFAALLARCAADPAALAGVFPGPAGAATALRAEGPGRWRTWHGYPQSGELVLTWGELA